MDLGNIPVMGVKIDHEYYWLVTEEIGYVAIEAFVIGVKMDFVRYAVEFDPVVVSEPKRYVAKCEKKLNS